MRISIDRLSQQPDVLNIIRAAFPSYRKQRASVEDFAAQYGGVTINSFWDGGSRDEFAIVELASLSRRPLPTQTHPYYDLHGLTQEGPAVSSENGNVRLTVLPEGFALVRGGVFCGKPTTVTVYVNPANLPRSLAA